MKKHLKNSIIAFVMIFSFLCTPLTTFAAENNDNSVGSIKFNNLSENPSQSFDGIDKNGDAFTIKIEKVENPIVLNSKESTLLPISDSITPLSWTTWKVSYTGVVVNCHFYMTVTNNKVTSVEDEYILTIGYTHSGKTLSSTTTYGKLSFDVTDYTGIVTFACWLKGTVTGADNDITVSWQM